MFGNIKNECEKDTYRITQSKAQTENSGIKGRSSKYVEAYDIRTFQQEGVTR